MEWITVNGESVEFIIIVVALACSLGWLATAGARFLPPLFVDVTHTGPLSRYFLALDGLVSAVALVMLWTRRRSPLDLCLLIVMCAWIAELALTGLITNARFSFGFYAGRVFSFATSIIVLSVLISESTRMYACLARSNAMLKRERDNKLMSFENCAPHRSGSAVSPRRTQETLRTEEVGDGQEIPQSR